MKFSSCDLKCAESPKELGIENSKLNPFVEAIVKPHLEIIILSLLLEKPMCGYDIIKTIFSRYGVSLSQGTVYPRLYSLREEGVLEAGYLRANMKTKRYSLTEEGMEITIQKKAEFNKAINYVFDQL